MVDVATRRVTSRAIVGNETQTVGERLHWAYANLAMAHRAVSRQSARYGPVEYAIRAKLYRGLREGQMTVDKWRWRLWSRMSAPN